MSVYDPRVLGFNEAGFINDDDRERLTIDYVEKNLSRPSIEVFFQSLKDGNRLCEALHEVILYELCFPSW